MTNITSGQKYVIGLIEKHSGIKFKGNTKEEAGIFISKHKSIYEVAKKEQLK